MCRPTANIVAQTCDEQTPFAVEVEQGLPPLALPVLDHVSLIQNQILPLFAPEHLGILHKRNMAG